MSLPPEASAAASPPLGKGGKKVQRGPQGRKGTKRGKAANDGTVADSGKSAVPKVKDDVFLVVSITATGRTPLNGWVLSLGAVAIAAQTRRVLGVLSRNFLPLLPHTNIEPSIDVAGYLRKQRAELELFYRRGTQVPAEEAMKDLKAFCEPYANLTLVANPLFSVYGWLSYYWTHTFPASGQAPPPPMPWGFSGVCAKSHASGCLGVPAKKLSGEAAYQASFEGYRNVGIPLGDALAAAVSFTHLCWSSQASAKGETAVSPPPPMSFDCELPALLAEIGCVPPTAPAVVAGEVRWCSALPGTRRSAKPVANEGCGGGSGDDNLEEQEGAASGAQEETVSTTFPAPRPLLECVVDKASILDGLASTENSTASAVGTGFTEYPSITDSVHHPEFLDELPKTLVEEMEWVATEKVHGSNFSIFCDGVKLWAAKRTGYLNLKHSSGFFEFAYLMEDARESLMKAYRLVLDWLNSQTTSRREGGVVVVFMCELAGGVYPHRNVPVDIRGGRVQNGVYYSPKNILYGFDIAIQQTGCAELVHRAEAEQPDARLSFAGKDGRFYLPFDDASRIFKESGFEAYSQALHRGSLKEMLSLPLEFPSTIATGQLGLPPIITRKNEAEGYVVRPTRDVWVLLRDSAAAPSQEQKQEGAASNISEGETEASGVWARVVLKRKHPRFDEFATTNNATSLRQHQGGAEGNSEGGEAQVDLTPFLTAGRVESVLSKYTEDEREDQSRMVAAVLADALKDAKRFSSVTPSTQQ